MQLARLTGGAQVLTVTQAASCCGVYLAGLSLHLAVLRQSGVDTAEKRGREVSWALSRTAWALNRTAWAAASGVVADWMETGSPDGNNDIVGCGSPMTEPAMAQSTASSSASP